MCKLRSARQFRGGLGGGILTAAVAFSTTLAAAAPLALRANSRKGSSRESVMAVMTRRECC